jgi:hypothetical protein
MSKNETLRDERRNPGMSPITARPLIWPRSPTREGKRVVTVYLDESAWRELKMLGLNNGRTTQWLVQEAINLLLRSQRPGG